MQTNYTKLTLAIAGGMIIANSVKTIANAATAATTMWWAKRQLKKEMEAFEEKEEE